MKKRSLPSKHHAVGQAPAPVSQSTRSTVLRHGGVGAWPSFEGFHVISWLRKMFRVVRERGRYETCATPDNHLPLLPDPVAARGEGQHHSARFSRKENSVPAVDACGGVGKTIRLSRVTVILVFAFG